MLSTLSAAFCFFLFLSLSPLIEATLSPEQIDKRVNAHLVIADFSSACEEAFVGVCQYPDSTLMWLAYIRALARAGDEKAMMLNWKTFIEKFPEERENHEILESLAWAVIDKGATSSSPVIRVSSMLGAFFSQDAKGVKILQRGLCDDNSFLRGAAVKLSSHLMDASLQDELLKLLQTEKVWRVRLEVIQAIGVLQIVEAKRELKKIIASDHCHADEKTVAIESLVSLTEGIDKQQMTQLVASNRAGMRILACELISFFDQIEDIDLLFPLIDDPHSDVRAKIFQTLGRLRVATMKENSVIEIAEKACGDPDSTVAVTAAWVLTINRPEKGMLAFKRLLNHPIRDTRYLAAAALAATGKYGLTLTKDAFNQSQDPYVKMNLAIGLIGQRVETKPACDCLFLGLAQHKERWAWDETNNFRVLAPSKAKHDDAIPNYPEALNQLTRLEILQMLAIVKYPYAQQAVKKFLQESNWGISGIASALLLTEGDDDAVDLVRTLLKDNDPKVRTQAALILALWGKGEDVVQLLQENYAIADREMKGKILEGIGRVGSRSSLIFLAERLQEPYQTLRIISAAALLECLYH